jgi:hypothetical protein
MLGFLDESAHRLTLFSSVGKSVAGEDRFQASHLFMRFRQVIRKSLFQTIIGGGADHFRESVDDLKLRAVEVLELLVVQLV